MLARNMSKWVWQGERGMLRSFDGTVADANAAARALAEQVASLQLDEVVDIVAGARTLLVELAPGREASTTLLGTIDSEPTRSTASLGTLHTIRVTYDGPDLDEVARVVRMSIDDIISLHTSVEYSVAFIGFQPGFPYLLGLPQRLVVPRLETPRSRVPAGSVAIAGDYTGIYQAATPGGWRLLGRTDAVLFDPTAERPCLLFPGDRVRFLPA